jgi:hypothetical protein
MAPKILQYFDQDLCDDTINHETIENIDFDEDELLEPSTAQTTPPPIPEFVQILVFNKRIPLDANNSYIVIVTRIVRFEEVLSGVRFDGPSFHENDYKKNTRLLDVIQNNAYTLGMSTYISDPRPFTPSISPTTSNRFKSQYGNATNAQNIKTQPQDSLSSGSKKKKSKKNKISKSKIAHSKGPNKNKDKVKFNGKLSAKTQHHKSKYQCR